VKRALLASLAIGCGLAPAAEARFDRWTSLRSSGMARTEVAAARVGGAIYVVGGFVRAGNATTAAVERYDIARNRWTRVRDMPVGLNHPAAVSHGGRLYVLGGYTADRTLSGETGAFLRYDPARDRWTRMPPMPTRRAALAGGVIGDRIYAAGGAASDGSVFKRLEVFDLSTRRWSRGPNMAVPREHVAGAVSQGAFYVAGGRPGDLAVAERYVPRLRRWQRLPDLRTPRSGIAAATVGRLVVVFGGETARGTIRPVEAFDPATRRWRALPGMRTPRHGLGGASLGRRVYSLEGGPRPGFAFSSALEALDVRG
jgi:N-acetylneuraminic acid mutarotase